VHNKFRFLAKHHIRDKATFDAVFASRKKLGSPYGVLRYSENKLDHPRVGIIASKRNVRLSVKRNLLRRIIKEQFRLHQDELCGYDIVFVVYKQAEKASSSEFHRCLAHLFNTLVKRSRKP
jgi:ribonuclease P protein component